MERNRELRGYLRSLDSEGAIQGVLDQMETGDIKAFASYLHARPDRVAEKLWAEKCVSAAQEGNPIR